MEKQQNPRLSDKILTISGNVEQKEVRKKTTNDGLGFVGSMMVVVITYINHRTLEGVDSV